MEAIGLFFFAWVFAGSYWWRHFKSRDVERWQRIGVRLGLKPATRWVNGRLLPALRGRVGDVDVELLLYGRTLGRVLVGAQMQLAHPLYAGVSLTTGWVPGARLGLPVELRWGARDLAASARFPEAAKPLLHELEPYVLSAKEDGLNVAVSDEQILLLGVVRFDTLGLMGLALAAEQLAEDVERARREIGPLPWEVSTRSILARLAVRRGYQLDEASLRLTARLTTARVSVAARPGGAALTGVELTMQTLLPSAISGVLKLVRKDSMQLVPATDKDGGLTEPPAYETLYAPLRRALERLPASIVEIVMRGDELVVIAEADDERDMEEALSSVERIVASVSPGGSTRESVDSPYRQSA